MATIKDVARVAGVSTSTASRALHDSSMISEATKRRVRRAMKELDYSPNYSAQNLVNRTTNTIGVILPVRESQDSLGNNPFSCKLFKVFQACVARMTTWSAWQQDEQMTNCKKYPNLNS